MAKNKMYGVITGDIIGFSEADGGEKDSLISSLKEAFEIIAKKNQSDSSLPSFDIFRGDSFQGVIDKPGDALAAGLIIRSSLIKYTGSAKGDWDARIAIGIGTIDHLPENISEGDGPAYRNSGPVLDNLKGEYKMAITLPDKSWNGEFKASSALLDAVINKWTPPQAEIVLRLLQDKTQKEIGQELGISEAAVHYRVKAAGWFAIREFLTRYENIIQNI